MKKDKLLLIDGNSLAFRAFFALPGSALKKFVNEDGVHTNAIFVFNKMLKGILEKYKPDKVLVAFDAGKKTFRNQKFDNYKAGRSKTPAEFSEQIPYIKELLDAYGIAYYDLPNFEADDIIGTAAKEADESGRQVIIITGDRDLTQLASENVTVAVTKKGVTDIEEYTPAHISEKLGITPEQIIDMKGLAGDTSDNYPGVTKVGEKTALKLLHEYGTIENIYENIEKFKKSKLKEHLIEDKDNAFMSKDLATIRRNAPIKLPDIDYRGPNEDELISFYRKMGFKSLLKNEIPKNIEVEELKYEELNEDNLNELNNLSDHISFYLEMIDSNYHNSEINGFSICDDNFIFVSDKPELLKNKILSNLLMSKDIKKNVFDVKRTYYGLHRMGIEIDGINSDVLLQSYLLDTNDNSNDLGQLAHQNDYLNIQTDEEVYGKGKKRALPEKKVFLNHLATKAKAIEFLGDNLFIKLNENAQADLYWKIELPLAIVLAQMEITGMKVNSRTLIDMQGSFTDRLGEIKQDIYNIAGEEFNIKSPKQLGEILFDKMGLPVIKKTKTGYSTAVNVLEKLRDASPIIDYILNYRMLSKINSTYLNGLLKVINQKDSKIHTTFVQTLTQTGRLSSIEPNLQNIPIRIDEGKQIRKAFVSEYEDGYILSSDYSQIELRVLAHITKDKNLQEAFKKDEDIHASTAVKIFGLDSSYEVTPLMRRHAKAVNFGIVYGISDYGLSQSLGISRKKAQQFIDTYFKEFPGVAQYVKDIVEKAKKNGYVETISNRRRYLPDINSKNFNLRSFAERTAMNSPIQGSAADIIKIAMINVQNAMKEHNLKSKMILQVHDELIFDVPADEIEVMTSLVPKVMDSAYKLDVPLKVETSYGKNWYEAK